MKKFRNIASKSVAFIVLVVMCVLLLGTVIGCGLMVEEGVYLKNRKDWYQECLGRSVNWNIALPLLSLVTEGNVNEADDFCNEQDVFYVEVKGAKNEIHYLFGEQDGRSRIEYVSDWEVYNGAISSAGAYDESVDYEPFNVRIVMKDELTSTSSIYYPELFAGLMFSWKYWIWALLALEVFLSIGLFCYLMWASGRREDGSVTKGWGTFVPIEILTVATAVAVCVSLCIIDETFGNEVFSLCLAGVLGVFCISISLGWCMSVALRLKLGILINESLCAYLWKGVKKVITWVVPLVIKIPLVWRTCLVLAGASALHLLWFIYFQSDWDMILLGLAAEVLLIPFVLLYIAIAFYILRKGAKSLAEGDLSAQIDTKYLVADLKAHGKDLNNIGCAVAKAVEERLKSERMKTELITNVSHDIKTPVTSIINFSDLIQKESDPDKIKEYAEVIERQSEKLKNLVEDLVEASKASTGNLEMQLMPMDVGVLLTQAAGEYEERLKDAGLELIMNCPKEHVMIMADGRRMWRVFDNLLNNICKYSLSKTRVYLTMENKGKEVCITFRNTSRDALNIEPEELLERFTRADASRHTEGNGLGLSIAKSLVQLQNGTLELAIDGDLFKAVITFPRVTE